MPKGLNNTNRKPDGTEPEGPGGVYVARNTATFTSCFIDNTKQAKPIITVTTITGWSLTIDASVQDRTVSGQASALTGRWTNGINSTAEPSTLKVDAQGSNGIRPNASKRTISTRCSSMTFTR